MRCMWHAEVKYQGFHSPLGHFWPLLWAVEGTLGVFLPMKGPRLVVNPVDLQETKLTAMQIIPRVDQGPEFAAAQAANPALKPLFQQAVSADPQFRTRGGLLYHVAKEGK